MNNNIVSAKEILRQSKETGKQIARFDAACENIIEALNTIARIVSSEDSSLGDIITKFAQTYAETNNIVDVKYRELCDIMYNYGNSTIENESSTEEAVTSLNNMLDEVISIINGVTA